MGTTSLGMPALPPRTSAPPWKTAWDTALYGEDGFFRREAPGAHFRTSVTASPRYAEALVELLARTELDTLVDVGAGRGELLEQVHRLDPGITLLGVEVAPRPPALASDIGWTATLPSQVEGLMIANEWLDNVPCHVVEVDPDGVPRIVHVDPTSGQEELGAALSDAGVPPSLTAWCQRWWPLPPQPGLRAEVGTTRDAAWSDVVARLSRGVAIAVDYGHLRGSRPPAGSLRSYRRGREVDVLPDGSRDVTAGVALDAVAAATGGFLTTQHAALRALGVTGERPRLALATSDPATYLQSLAAAGEGAELTAEGGLGDFAWLVSSKGVDAGFLRA
jgi:SAM-dependent MidA family methyltransferase